MMTNAERPNAKQARELVEAWFNEPAPDVHTLIPRITSALDTKDDEVELHDIGPECCQHCARSHHRKCAELVRRETIEECARVVCDVETYDYGEGNATLIDRMFTATAIRALIAPREEK